MTTMTILIVAKNGTCCVMPDFPVEGDIFWIVCLVAFVSVFRIECLAESVCVCVFRIECVYLHL